MVSVNAHQLKIFLVAAETQNFTQAAQRLNLTQPGISQNIQGLEDHFGLPLFIRAGRALQLTDAGKALIPLAQDLVNLSIHLEEAMESLKEGVHGHLIIGCCAPSGRYLLPKLLAGYHLICPHVHATCQILSQSEALEKLASGTIHIVVTCSPQISEDLEYSRLAEEEIVLIVHPAHPWSQRGEVELSELAGEKFILPGQDLEIYKALDEELSKQGFSLGQLKAMLSLGSLEGIALSVQEGLGVGFVPKLLMSRLVPDWVVPVRIKNLHICRTIYIGRSLRHPLSCAQGAFWNYIKENEAQVIDSVN